MKQFFSKLLTALLILLGIGGLVCAIILAANAKAWIPLIAILVLGGIAYPSFKKLVEKLSSLQ